VAEVIEGSTGAVPPLALPPQCLRDACDPRKKRRKGVVLFPATECQCGRTWKGLNFTYMLTTKN